MCLESHISHSAKETKLLGAKFSESLNCGDVVALIGDLGSGKTTFVQGISLGLGIKDVVNSPTFKIVSEYFGRIPLYHIDFFRIESFGELIHLGLEHYLFGDGVTVIEWADRFPTFVPANITITFKGIEGDESQRQINIKRHQ